jgi:hypothetical protein
MGVIASDRLVRDRKGTNKCQSRKEHDRFHGDLQRLWDQLTTKVGGREGRSAIRLTSPFMRSELPSPLLTEFRK